MSALAGVAHVGGRPAAPAEVAVLLRWMAHRGPDGASVVRADGAALGVADMLTTPEAQVGQQPLADPESGLVVTFDGRLDNRDELGAAGAGPARSDVDLVLAAYRRWGVECAGRLRGPFAVAVWDAPRRTLFAARDVFGGRPFFYRAVDGSLWWASEVQALARTSGAAVNEGYVAERLADRATSTVETVYAGISRLPMAHALVADGRGAPRTWRYWTPEPEAPAGALGLRDAHELVRSRLREATGRTLRRRGGVTLFLSGGVDAASVGAAVAGLRDAGLEAAATVRAVTLAFPGRGCDETATASAVAGDLGIDWQAVPARAASDADLRDLAVRSAMPPEPPNAVAGWPLRALAAERGRVVLTGVGAEESFGPTPSDLSDLIAGWHLVRAARWARADGALLTGLWGALPSLVKPPIRFLLRRPRVPEWITPSLASRVGLVDRLRGRRAPRLPTRAATELVAWLTSGEMESLLEQHERGTAAFGLEERQPFFQREIVELALAMPAGVRSRPDLPKAALREAMRGWLPEDVTGPPPPLDFGWILGEFVDRLGGARRFGESPVVQRGWVEPDVLERCCLELRPGSQRHHWTLWSVLAVDYWLRALEARPSPAPALEVAVRSAGGKGIV